MNVEAKRNPVFDIMKGIGIILMLIGHIPPRESVFHVIYSFHMPLFFLIAGAFANVERSAKDAIVKDFKRLVLPVLVTMSFIIVLSPMGYIIDGNFNSVIAQMLSLLWLGDAVNTRWGMLTIDSMWFLMALFWAKGLFRGIVKCCERIRKLRDEIILVICVAMSFTSISLHNVLPPIPFGLLKGVSAIQFYAIGWYLKHHKMPNWVYVLCVCAWFLALRYGGINMVFYYYGCYPLDVMGAVGATALVYLLSKAICNYLTRTSKLLQCLGVNSLAILCINTLDRKTNLVRAIKYVLGLKITGFPSVMFHYAIELAILLVVVQIAWMRSLYGIKQWKEL